MTVAELIAALETADPNAEVKIQGSTFQYQRSVSDILIADVEGRVATTLQGHGVKYHTGLAGRVFIVESAQ